jgi:predicted nucleotidyltransferase
VSQLLYEVRNGKAVWGGRLLREWVDDVGQAIVDRCDPTLVILFGSVADGSDGPDSDLDLLVVLDTAPPDARRAVMTDLRRATRSTGVPRDIVVTSMADFERNRVRPGTLEHESARNGVVIHDKRPAA